MGKKMKGLWCGKLKNSSCSSGATFKLLPSFHTEILSPHSHLEAVALTNPVSLKILQSPTQLYRTAANTIFLYDSDDDMRAGRRRKVSMTSVPFHR